MVLYTKTCPPRAAASYGAFYSPQLLSRSQPWELFCSSRYFLSLWSISHGLTSHFWGAFVKRPRKYPEIYLFGFSSCSKHPSPQGALLSGQPSIIQQKLGEWLLSLPVSYLVSSRSSVKSSPDRAVGSSDQPPGVYLSGVLGSLWTS